MKVTIEIDCTPDEARAFLGLPDVAPLHAEAMAALKARIGEAAASFDPETALKAWLGASGEGLDRALAFWRGMAKTPPGGSS